MARVRTVAALALMGGLVVGGWSYVQAAKSSRLSAQDYTEITELYARLYQGSDLRELDTWIANFTDDGVYIFPDGDRASGRAALVEWRKKAWAGQTGDSKKRHWTSGVMLTPMPDGTAKGRAYWMMIDANKKQPVVTHSGTFDDVFVKTSDGWKFKQHGVQGDSGE